MYPTIKFRLLKSHGFVKGDPFLTDSYGNYYKVQQWWDSSKLIEIDGAARFETSGEWRDIDIEVEE